MTSDSLRAASEPGRRIQRSPKASDVQLTWKLKDHRIDADSHGKYERSELASEPEAYTHEILDYGHEESNGWLIVGDAQFGLLEAGEKLSAPHPGVTLCYIDPPFNTGESFTHYNDKMDRNIWLSLLRDRLVQIRDLLADDGSIWLHLDDSEQHRGRCLLDEVFGEEAFVATIIWQKRTSRESRTAFSSMHDYIHVYSPGGASKWKQRRNGLPDLGAYANPDNDPRGPWRSTPASVQAGHATPAQFYTVVTPTGAVHDPPAGRCWVFTQKRLTELDADGRIYWPRNGAGKPRLKKYQYESRGLSPFTIWPSSEVGDTASAKREIMAAFPSIPAFDTPKPEKLLERIIAIATNPGEVVLDCFLGSGTTAVVAARMKRRWVGIELSPATVETFVLPRLDALEPSSPLTKDYRVSTVSSSRARITANLVDPQPGISKSA